MIRSFFLLSLAAVLAAVVSCAPRTAPVSEQPAAAQQKNAERTAAAPTPAAPAPAQAAPATTGSDYQKSVDALIPGLAAEQIPDREQPQRELERLSNEAGRPGAEPQRDALCAAMIRRLGPDTPNATRLWILRKLEIIGTDACVPTLSACLEEADSELRDAARRTLQRFGTPTALNALAAALDRAKDPEWKVALLNALGTFRPAPAVLIAKYHLDPDERVVLAAIEALGTCQAMDATMVLYFQRKRDDLSPAMRLAVETSLLRLAEEFALSRDEKQANKAYDFLTVHASLSARMAILQGRVALRGDAMFRDLIKLITSDDAEILRKTAARLLRDLPDERATGAIAERSLKAQGEARVLLLEALADREDPAGAPAAMAALLTDKDDAVRAAALATLARIGDSAAIPLILDAAADGNQTVRPAARNAIDSLRGANIDDTLLSAIPGARPAAQAEILRALSARHCDKARDLFFQYAANPDERV
ncbi:MAG: HEAT repeat domain-containing protein, partial [Planctomycetes bacterium]|nr:HEAT repeat domain-containing protein [Planctomycetota bacterium]